jgi:sugar phosphate isomerase/epimerase
MTDPPGELRFSCADFTFPLLPHERVLTLLRLLDFDAVDVGIFAGRSHIQPKDVTGSPKQAAAELGARLADHGLDVSDVFLQTGPEPALESANAPDPAVRKHVREMFLRTLEYAVALGAGHMTGLPGVVHPGVMPADSFNLAAEEASWRAEAAKQAGVIYGVEAHVGSVCPDPSSALAFLQRANGVTLTLDYGHFISEGLASEEVHPLLSYASHFHARGGCPGRLQASVKDNTIDFKFVADWLRNHSYRGYVCLEYVWIDWRGCNRTDNLSETILLRDQMRTGRSRN